MDIISSQTAGEAGPVVGPVLLHPGLVLLLGEVAGVEDAGEPVESLHGVAHQVEANQLPHICNITRITG